MLKQLMSVWPSVQNVRMSTTVDIYCQNHYGIRTSPMTLNCSSKTRPNSVYCRLETLLEKMEKYYDSHKLNRK